VHKSTHKLTDPISDSITDTITYATTNIVTYTFTHIIADVANAHRRGHGHGRHGQYRWHGYEHGHETHGITTGRKHRDTGQCERRVSGRGRHRGRHRCCRGGATLAAPSARLSAARASRCCGRQLLARWPNALLPTLNADRYRVAAVTRSLAQLGVTRAGTWFSLRQSAQNQNEVSAAYTTISFKFFDLAFSANFGSGFGVWVKAS
jgi:hypothetical protein